MVNRQMDLKKTRSVGRPKRTKILSKEQTVVNIDCICRICLRTAVEQDMNSLDSLRKEETIANMIIDCGGVQVSSDDELPKSVCSICLERLEDAYSLRKMIRSSESSLREMTSNVKIDSSAQQHRDNGKSIFKKSEKYIKYPTEDQIESITKFESYTVIRLKGVRCCGCQAILDSKEELRVHSIKYHSTNAAVNSRVAFQCSTCNEQFPNRMKLLNHTKNYDSNEMFHCTLCNVVFDIKYRLEQHQNLSKAHRNPPDPLAINDMEEEAEKGSFIRTRTSIRKRATKELKYPSEEFIIDLDDYSDYQIVYIRGERCCGCDQLFRNYQELVDHCTLLHPRSEGEATFECTLCSEKFEQVQSYNRHNSARTQKELYFCKLCDLIVDVRFRFEQHLKTSAAHQTALEKSDIKPSVPLGERTSSENRALEASIQTIEINDLRCCGCNFVCNERAELEKHSKEKHDSERTVDDKSRMEECNVCFKRFSSPELLMYHHNASLESTVHKCKHCEFQSEVKSRVMQHVASGVHKNAEKVFKIDEIERKNHACCFVKCTLVFKDSSSLLEHVNQNHASKRRENAEEREYDDYICYVCHKSFRNEKSLQIHQFPRKTDGQHVCKECGASFHNLSTFNAHEKMHSGTREFQCDVCDKAFYDERTLRIHKVCHNEERPYVCDVCSKSFLRKGNLKVHKRCHSKGIWECSYCQEKFKTNQSLVLHIRYHTGEKPYQCRYCENRYSHTTDRQRHEMAAHTKVRPHKCSECPAAFIRKRQLTIHERTHTGERPFVCPVCDKGFIQNNFLTKHLAMHEKTEETKETEYTIEMLDMENEEEFIVGDTVDVFEEQATDDDTQLDDAELMEVENEEIVTGDRI
ncbi:zinc finger protein 271-like [Malaya genurostris]|uniref:zinc finger protein 271-like n=1 Tax=Malaya genurostris TaxID=325434 RepID=UPI0026F3FC2B|nr:zinc finger protein 271-like [Malaya genurostris]